MPLSDGDEMTMMVSNGSWKRRGAVVMRMMIKEAVMVKRNKWKWVKKKRVGMRCCSNDDDGGGSEAVKDCRG
ncbi:uncharacterized protein DS421_12g374430 [Arachis hypogaea]|nr:uncharacterized protein DS421_12g374430 [Arachis hypogaea]